MAQTSVDLEYLSTLSRPEGIALAIVPAKAARLKNGLSILTIDELPEWDLLVEQSPLCSVFSKSWWLMAACDQVRVLGLFEAGRLLAGIPLYYKRRMGLRICRMPLLTQTMGVVIAALPGKRATVESRETEILSTFAEYLAHEQVFVQAFHPSSQNWLPFYWHGFTQTTHYTYVLEDLSSIDRLWDELSKERRNNIRKALKLGLTVKECGPEKVFLAAGKSFERQGKKMPYSFDHLARLYHAARANDAGVCMSVEDAEGNVHAASFFVWDSKRGYHLAGGHDPAFSSSGGFVLLVWKMIEFAAKHTAAFDFEGSMVKQIETSYRSFGGKRIAYNRIVKMPRWMRICLLAAGKLHV